MNSHHTKLFSVICLLSVVLTAGISFAQTKLLRFPDIYGDTEGMAWGTARNIIEMAALRVAPENILYLEVTEEDNPRRSFDVNVYRADMRMQLFYPLFLEMCGHYDISVEEFQAVFKPSRDKTLGHISGGIDREGNDFFTVYYGMEGH